MQARQIIQHEINPRRQDAAVVSNALAAGQPYRPALRIDLTHLIVDDLNPEFLQAAITDRNIRQRLYADQHQI